MCNTPNHSYFQRVLFFYANLKCWLLIVRNLILAVFLAFFGRKLILVVFRQPFKIEACVMRQVVLVFSVFHFLTVNLKCWPLIGRKLIGLFFGIFWSETNIGCISATVQDRSMCNTSNRSYFQRVLFFKANLKCWLMIGQKLIQAVFSAFFGQNLIYWLYFGNLSR